MATLHELQTVYGLRDVYDMIEIILVDAHNRNVVDKLRRQAQEAGGR